MTEQTPNKADLLLPLTMAAMSNSYDPTTAPRRRAIRPQNKNASRTAITTPPCSTNSATT